MFKDHVLSLQCHAVILAALFLDTLPPYFFIKNSCYYQHQNYDYVLYA